ncbi:MAG: antibiotic biosynthesis monooxygenase [Alphaproteobacteria bacterium]|nr:antibiotic biosynthesis monooxygenase [Alphaproteobacteria bacterium]
MFSVLFEAQPRPTRWGEFLDNVKTLGPELQRVDGFVEDIRYKSMQRDGWILSLSSWRDEKAVVRWRTTQSHHIAQQQGRDGILSDYHLRVGEIFADNKLPRGMALPNQRSDETEIGPGTMVTIVTATRPPGHPANVTACSQYLGLDIYSGDNLIEWDVYDAVLAPGDLCLVLVWKGCGAVEYFERGERMLLPETHRIRHVRVIRDYTMVDRREAPQYFPSAGQRREVQCHRLWRPSEDSN